MRKILLITLFVLIPIVLFSTTWTVIPAGGGDFTTITAALASVSVVNGDIITVYEDTYTENITINKNITLQSRSEGSVNSTIIDGSNYPSGATVTISALTVCTLQGFTISSSGIGILISNNSSTINNCIIMDNTKGIEVNEGSEIYCNPTIQNCIIYGNTSDGIKLGFWSEDYITNNEIYSNGGHGINCYGNPVDEFMEAYIYDNEIYDNDQSGIYGWYAYIESFGNLIYENGDSGIRLFQCNELVIENSTISDNVYGIYLFDNYTNTASILNSIIWGNTYFTNGDRTSSITFINYSCFPTQLYTYTTTGSINDDPLFEDASNDDFSLEWSADDKSPCIDTGDPNSDPDPDDTRADMGAFYCDHEEQTYTFYGAVEPHDGWTWLCFDILDITTPNTTNQVQNLFDTIKLNLDHGEHEGLEFYYIYNPPFSYWYHGTEVITSPKGYKIEMDATDSFIVDGFRCPEDTSFDIDEGDSNWIGYFIEDTQHVYEAFDGYLDNIFSIEHQEWSIDSQYGWPDIGYTLSPGDMVVVKCEEDITSFTWPSTERSRTEPFVVLHSQLYDYTEEDEYLPIYVELDENDLPDEIAVFVDDVCYGARVVQHSSENICAYITDLQSGDVEIEFAYYDRNARQRFTNYAVIDNQTGNRETTSIDLRDKHDYYYISFKSNPNNTTVTCKMKLSNYPNPFNPTTTIFYDIPKEGNIEISIYNLKGEKVKELINGTQPSGSYSVQWNGLDNSGKKVASGLYLYKLKANDHEYSKKMLLLK